jgi:hypothetical protein
MKIKTVKYIFSVLVIIFAFTSCDKEEVTINQSQIGTTKDILTFATQEDFDKTLAKVNAMTKEERLEWEKEQGFKSFGTICDEFYDNIDFEKFKSIEDVRNLDPKNQYLDIYMSSGNYNIEPKEMVSKEKFIANNERMFIISNRVYKIVESKLVSANVSNISSLKLIESFDKASSNPIFELNNPLKISNRLKIKTSELHNLEAKNSNYKTEFRYQTENFWVILPATTYREVEYTIKNYKKSWAGWYYAYELSTNYDILLESYDDSSEQYFTLSTSATNDNIKSENRSEKLLTNSELCTNELDPYFSYTNGYVTTAAGTIPF